MGELGFGFLLGALGALAWSFARRRAERPLALWTWGWVALVASAAFSLAAPAAPGLAPLVDLLGPFLPAFLLAGTLAWVGRPVPGWLLPVAAGVGLARWGLALAGLPGLSHGLALAFEPGAGLAAALLAGGWARSASGRTAWLLPSGLAAVACVDAATSLAGLRAPGLDGPLLLAWIAVAFFTYGVQVRLALGRRDHQQQHVEAALSRSERRFRLLADHAFDLVAEMDERGRFTYANPRFQSVLGYEPGALVGRSTLELVHPDDRERVRRETKAVLDRGVGPPMSIRVRRADGTWRWLESTAGALPIADGPRRLVVSSRDVTERKRRESDQERARDALEAAVAERTRQLRREEQERRRLDAHVQEVQRLESLGLLAGGIAHDFNNALSVILGNVSLAGAEVDPQSRLGGRLEKIRSAARHAEALTDQMLAYAGKSVGSLKPLDLSRLVEDTEDLLRACVSQGCEVRIEAPGGVPRVDGDVTQLRQVLVNLVTNASEALAGRAGRVHVRTGLARFEASELAGAFGAAEAGPGEYVVLEVADTGPGMSEELRSHVFEPFFTTRRRGRGLGLAAVLGIVRGHHGLILLESRAGTGSRFRVLLRPSSAPAHAESP